MDVLEKNGLSINVLGDSSHGAFAEQRQKLVDLLQKRHISPGQIEALARSIPATVEALKAVSGHVKDSQVAASLASGESRAKAFEIIGQIVQQASCPEMLQEAMKTTERMNSDNNRAGSVDARENGGTFKIVAIAILGGLMLIAGGAAAAKVFSGR